jgi:hypothetical protein
LILKNNTSIEPIIETAASPNVLANASFIQPLCDSNEYFCGSKCHPVMYFNDVPLRYKCVDGNIINSTLIYFSKMNQ